MTLLADALELWDPTNGYAFEVRAGRPGKDLPVFRGENVTLPSKPGQTWMPKVADHFVMTLYGQVVGDGAGQTAAESFMDRMQALKDILDPENGQFVITVDDGNEGLATGESATITVEFVRWTIATEGGYYRIGDIECLCISDPSGWAIDLGGS